MKSRVVFLIILSFVIIISSGCLKGVGHITINKDQTADLDLKFSVNNNLLNLLSGTDNPMDDMKNDVIQRGFNVRMIKENGYIGINASKHYKNFASLKKDIDDLFGIEASDKFNIEIDKGLIYNKYTLNTKIDLREEKTTTSLDENTKDDSVKASIDPWLANQMDFKLRLSLPEQAIQNNASRILGENNTYEWDLIYGQDNQIYIETRVPNIRNIIFLIILLAISVSLGVILYILRSRKIKYIE